MSQRKPTALDLILSAINERNLSRLEGIDSDAARRELQVKTELCEADDAIDEMKFHGSIVEAVERRAKARDAYRRWITEQQETKP